MLPIDKALLGKVSEPPGRNENEHRGSLVRYNPKAEGSTTILGKLAITCGYITKSGNPTLYALL